MRIECDITGLVPQETLIAFFKSVLEFASSRVGLKQAFADRIVIASEDRFGPVLTAINPTSGCFTNRENAIAGGKTVPRRVGDRVVSDVVLMAFLFETLAAVWDEHPMPNDWDVDAQESLYVICHEFGHATDFALRNDPTDDEDPRASAFSIRRTTNYYASIVLTEFAACRNSVAIMSEALFNHELVEAAKRIGEHQAQTRAYLRNEVECSRNTSAHVICNGLWAIMADLARLYGSSSGQAWGNGAVRNLEAAYAGGTSPLGDLLGSSVTSYPRWDMQELRRQLGGTWQQFAAQLNVRFFERAGEPDDFEMLRM